jgi:hypothetical protein
MSRAIASLMLVCLTMATALPGISQPAPRTTATPTSTAQSPAVVAEASRNLLIGTIVTAVLVLIGTIVTARATVRAAREKQNAAKSEEKLEKINEQIEVSSRAFEEQMKQKYGVSAKGLGSRCEILNLNGDGKIVRTWTGLKVGPGVTMDALPGHFEVSSPGARIVGEPRLSLPAAFGKTLKLDVTLRTATRCEYVVRAIGSLKSDDSPLDYSVEISFEKAFAMWSEDIDAAYGRGPGFPFEYHGISVEMPADLLTLEVLFPEGYSTESNANIFFLGSEVTYAGPAARLNPDRNGRLTRLDIVPPLLGFRYIIFWKGAPRPAAGISTS